MANERKIIIIRDEESKDILGVYDITDMDGDVKDYYGHADEFDSMDAYEEDLFNRGAKEVSYTDYLI